MKKEAGQPLLHSSFLLSTFPVLANGSVSSNQSGEGDIRRALIEADLEMTNAEPRLPDFDIRTSSFELRHRSPRPALLQHANPRLPLVRWEK
jgi:hypothetical protein